jgi:hypothetical protein
VRKTNMVMPNRCGMHRGNDGGLFVILCQPGNEHDLAQAPKLMPAVELLSLSRKATSIAGRKFDRVLEGRAQFRAATEAVAEVSAWSALFLFYLGSEIMAQCSRRNANDQTCTARGLAVWAVAGITAVFSGTIWLIGRASNPATDSRFIHLMYESTWMGI